MAAGAPLTRLELRASSVADDLGFVALADLGRVLSAGGAAGYRVIGGHMVTALVARWRLGADLYRETRDTDLGMPPAVVRNQQVVRRLVDLGYQRVAGNRFARTVPDVPVRVAGGPEVPRQAVIDVLIPAYTSRARPDRRVGDDLVTTEVPGLSTALSRDPILLTLELHRLNGELLEVELAFPDEVSALVLKGLAMQVRRRTTDAVDALRCLEVAFAAGIGPSEFAAGVPAEAASIVRSLFDQRDGPGMTAIVAEQRLSLAAGDERFTRLRALISRVLG